MEKNFKLFSEWILTPEKKCLYEFSGNVERQCFKIYKRQRNPKTNFSPKNIFWKSFLKKFYQRDLNAPPCPFNISKLTWAYPFPDLATKIRKIIFRNLRNISVFRISLHIRFFIIHSSFYTTNKHIVT